MVQISTRARRQNANRGFVWVLTASIAIHVGAFGAVVYAQSRAPKRPDVQRAIPVQLVRLGKPRDPKLLPRKQRPAQPPPPPDDAVALDTGEKKKKPERRKKRRRERPKREMSEAARRMLENAKLDEALSKIEDEPEGSAQGSPFGTTSDTSNAAAGYQAEIAASLQQAYRLPETIPPSQRRFLKARVVLYIEPTGRISDYEFVEKHPNEVFIAALERLLRSHTLPAPPKALSGQVSEAGIEVVFKP